MTQRLKFSVPTMDFHQAKNNTGEGGKNKNKSGARVFWVAPFTLKVFNCHCSTNEAWQSQCVQPTRRRVRRVFRRKATCQAARFESSLSRTNKWTTQMATQMAVLMDRVICGYSLPTPIGQLMDNTSREQTWRRALVSFHSSFISSMCRFLWRANINVYKYEYLDWTHWLTVACT